ncbi:winged helix-turn-helix domain-containing protein [Erwinia tracheiphila]|uniref:OmpR/PhoB-type domain-containing protein n=1 Tax=Erwinia tracheiphila TaxID=65700 RepID=A0A0M2KH50_9GAMM|nr:winged helix-turn-helix domain-containing protein [Erwinia tracheiphila]EOS93547.1 transcriptional regulator [Erwinia tracheiphila PSU-1]KKF36563.1 hypothetical protein SY86_15760 [Erwinia tracheiphila]UIA87897.1 winged helix-turn-helix domain-containing protein [Erwinia tracheiphila]UIA96482.1 winged helix-turn-helix domain-containing protein [Erwinia tracheiphila]
MSENIEIGNNIFLSEEDNYLTNKSIKLPIGEKEKKLISYFLRHPHIELTKKELINSIWENRAETIDDANLTQLIYKIRRNLAAVNMNNCIKTIPGKGYIYIPRKKNKGESVPFSSSVKKRKSSLFYSILTVITCFILCSAIYFLVSRH